MSDCNENKNPLKRGGTSQPQRFLAGLGKEYVRVEEREYADWILFAGEFSKYLHYYQSDGTIAGTWLPFFSHDVSAILGSIAVQNVEVYKRDIKERFDVLKNDEADEELVKRKLNEVFSAVFTLSYLLDRYYYQLEEKVAFKPTLLNLIKIKLAPALRRLLEYYKGALAENLLADSQLNNWQVLNSEVMLASSVVNGTGLSKNWWQGAATSWTDYYTNYISANTSVFGNNALTVNRRINRAAHHNLFTSVFDQYLGVYTKLIAEAEKELLHTLEDWKTHPAHYALFLAFLKLFRHAKEQINTVTGRHLDFYYKEVLRLHPKQAEPNKTHLLVTLAKQIESYSLTPSNLLKAGKDSLGKDVVYAFQEEESFNKAKVALLKAVYKGNSLPPLYPDKDDHPISVTNPAMVNNDGRLFASPVMNSADGLGKEIQTEQKEWHPYVNKVYKETKLLDIAMPNAQIGFAIASHYLYLSEGERTVYVRLQTNNNAALTNRPIECFITTEKGWFAIPSADLTSIGTGTMSNSQACAEITFTLHGDAPAITNYQAALHGGTFDKEVPLLKIQLKNEDTASYPYNSLYNLLIYSIELKVEVGNPTGGINQTGLKELFLSNDFGPLDPAKPFQPFGPQPKKDNTFLIGNKEVFTKKNAKIRLNIEWAGLSDFSYLDIDYDTVAPTYPNAKVQFLQKGIWTADSETNIFNNANTHVSVFASPKAVPVYASRPYSDEYGMYDSSSRSGFMRLVLNGNFGYKEYQEALTLHLIEASKPEATATAFLGVEPYLPVIQSLYISYSASVIASLGTTSTADFQNREVQFFHLYPFGEAEQHSNISKKSSTYLLPQFQHVSNGTLHPHVGELYIGLENLQARQSVQLLFQVLEGSTDPLVEKPEEHVLWEYLSGNEWKAFDKNQISDATRQLVQSGIISFVIPENATTHNTLLPSGYLWIKASIETSAEAICKILSIDAQAALVTFRPTHNAADFLDKALPSGSISKLKVPDTAIKKIEQPYASFGGRPTEDNAHFYMRVSERLRHKARAITIWDYEHLVLEAFPQIYKVKCLNHTKIDDGVYNEVLPGHVAIITIPSIVNRNDVNPLKPYTNQNTLLEIEEFLRKKISCHVKLTVRHPQFEEVRLRFKLKLLKGFDDFTFYSTKLKQEITEYLSPWAFDGRAEVQFGGKIQKSTLINFIEERHYVDFITDVRLFHKINELTAESTDKEEIEASTARSILVSAQAFKHDIEEAIVVVEQPESECSPHVT